MKNFAVSFLLLFGFSASALALGCDSTKKLHIKHELGLVFYSNQLEYFTIKDKSAFSQNFFNGIQYKIVVNRKNAFRTSFQYTQQVTNYETGPEYGWYFAENSFTKGYEVSAGYERIFCCGKIKPFVFADLSYSYYETRGYKEWWGCFGGGAGDFTDITNGQGVLAGIGIKYFPRRNIFLSLETSTGLNYCQITSTWEGYNPSTDKFFDFAFNPVKAFSFGLRF